jgi:hypothetical protein
MDAIFWHSVIRGLFISFLLSLLKAQLHFGLFLEFEVSCNMNEHISTQDKVYL